jgi:hypothetical protein
MQRLMLLTAAVCLLVPGCGPSQEDRASSGLDAEKAGESATAGDLVIGKPITHANLTIFPISSKELRNKDRFITLDEGLKAGTVEILEVGANRAAVNEANEEPADDQGNGNPFGNAANEPNANADANANGDPFAGGNNEVNRLMVLNKSGRPLYLMPGEIIVGGYQDRTIGQELVIEPGDEPVPINVFCVEHGRWNNREVAAFGGQIEGATTLPLLRDSVAVAENGDLKAAGEAANRGKFVATVGSLSKKARMAVQESKDQGDVWENVAEENAASNPDGAAPNASGTFAANYVAAKSVQRLVPYIEKVQKPVAEHQQVVGVIVAVDGKVETMDVFESTPLFKKLWPKLLKSYALDAANARSEKKKDAKPCTRKDAREFLVKVLDAEVKESSTEGSVVITTRSTDEVVSFSACNASPSEGGAAGGFGGMLHSSGFSK